MSFKNNILVLHGIILLCNIKQISSEIIIFKYILIFIEKKNQQ